MLKFNLSKKYSKTIPIIALSAFVLVIVAFISTNAFKSFAAPYTNITTQVTIGNTAPTIGTGPAESPATSATSPAAIGATITFSGTATDVNAESYYLIFCRTNSVTPGSGGSAPTCAASQTLCTSTLTASATGTSCTYTTLAGDSWLNAWYAFACDNFVSCNLSGGRVVSVDFNLNLGSSGSNEIGSTGYFQGVVAPRE